MSGVDRLTLLKGKIKWLQNQTVFMLLFLVFMLFVLSRLSPHFFTIDNLREITVQAAVITMLAAGQTFVILSGGIDLGMGSVVALSSVTSAMCMAQTGSAALGFPVGLIIGAFCGIINGFMIGKLNIPPFVATFGMMGMGRGVAYVVTGGLPQYQLAAGSDFLGQQRFLGVPIATITVLLLYIICYFILVRTKRGRYTYAIGSNKDAAFLSGINVSRQLIWIYMIAGITAGLAGITELSRVGSGQPGAGNGYELDAIASVVLGGASMSGGVGNIWGTLIGALIIVSLRSGLNVLNVNAYWQMVAIGVIVVSAVYADQVRNKMRKK
ncbi:MAG: ABC transporter permease [Spirochaetales bacterium]|nr:ABC transporter permease [Spirochaetales bacterium]